MELHERIKALHRSRRQAWEEGQRLLEDVGREFGVSRERIRQLQNVALAKMRKALMKKDKSVAHLSDMAEA